MIHLSHTAKEKYLRCPLSYYMHYILKLREEVVGSALPFGTAFGDGADVLTLGGTLQDAFAKFDELWEFPKINGVNIDAKTSNKIKYSKSDNKEELAETPWESLKIKGHLLLTQYQKDVISITKDVLAVQHKINIENSYGDVITGYVDKVLELNDGRIVLFDDKTSASKYNEDVITNPDGTQLDKAKQLALYFEALKDEFNIDSVGFFVAEKKIRKKDPKARIQIITGKLPEAIIKKTFDEFEQVLYNIKMGVFPSNHPNCNTYYGDCICNKYQKSGGLNTDGLIKVG